MASAGVALRGLLGREPSRVWLSSSKEVFPDVTRDMLIDPTVVFVPPLPSPQARSSPSSISGRSRTWGRRGPLTVAGVPSAFIPQLRCVDTALAFSRFTAI